MRIERLAIIGVGLIGGSLALALRKAGVVGEIIGAGRSRDNLETAVARGIVDRYEFDPLVAARDADSVFIATPVETIIPLATALRETVKAGAVVTDGGSVKQAIAYTLGATFQGAPAAFVPGHPIAGTEKTGAAAAQADLFTDRRTVLTPTRETPTWAIERVAAMWQAAGSAVEIMEPARHDAVFAAISHLPHATAFTLVQAVAALERESGQPILKYAASGFADATRIASSDPALWRDIFAQNRDALLHALDAYEASLKQLRELIQAVDRSGLEHFFAEAKHTRDELGRK